MTAYHVRLISDQTVSNGGIRLCYGQPIEKTAASEYIPGFISPYAVNGGNGSWNDPNKFKLLRKMTSAVGSGFVTYKWVIDANYQSIYENGVLVQPSNTAQVDPPGSGKTYVGPAPVPASSCSPGGPGRRCAPGAGSPSTAGRTGICWWPYRTCSASTATPSDGRSTAPDRCRG